MPHCWPCTLAFWASIIFILGVVGLQALRFIAESDKWQQIASQYSAEREHNAMQSLAFQAERDALRAQLEQAKEVLRKCEIQALTAKAQFAGYMLATNPSDSRNDIIFNTLDEIIESANAILNQQTK